MCPERVGVHRALRKKSERRMPERGKSEVKKPYCKMSESTITPNLHKVRLQNIRLYNKKSEIVFILNVLITFKLFNCLSPGNGEYCLHSEDILSVYKPKAKFTMQNFGSGSCQSSCFTSRIKTNFYAA